MASQLDRESPETLSGRSHVGTLQEHGCARATHGRPSMPGRHPARFRSSCPESRPSSPSHQRSAETGLQRHPDWSRRVRDSTEVQLSDAVVAGRRMPSCEVRVVLRVVVKLREGARCRSENPSSGCEESRHRAGIGPAAPRCGRSRSWR